MTIAAWMQPLQYDLQSSAAKDNSITHAAAAASNLDAATPMRSASTDSKTPYNYAHTSTPKAAWSHRYTAAKKKRPTDRSRTRRTDEVPFIVACSHFTRKNTKVSCSGFLPTTEPLQHHAAIPMRSASTDSKTPYNYTHTQAHPKQLEATVTLRQKKNDQPTAAAPAAQTRYLSSPAAATLHGKTQGFVLRLPPQLITSLPHHFPSSPLPIVTTSLRHRFPSSLLPFLTTSHRHHFPSSPLPFVTTSLRHHFPSSPLPFVTTSLRHHFPSSPLPFVTTSLRHHFPSSPLPFVTTPLHHHFPSSPLPFVTTPLHHHFPSSPLPFVTTSLLHHFPSSPLPFVTTPLAYHFPSSPLPIVTTSLRHHFTLCHHFPSSPLPFVTTRH